MNILIFFIYYHLFKFKLKLKFITNKIMNNEFDEIVVGGISNGDFMSRMEE